MADQLHFDAAGDVTIVSFGDRPLTINENVLQELSTPLLQSAQRGPSLLLDMSSVEFFGSSFIELLFRIWNRVKAQPGGQFALCNLHPYCREVLEVTNLDKLWKNYGSRAEALAALQEGTATWTPSS